jgi:hypothetical protein
VIAVLRGAVEALLMKRKIVYYPMKGKGSFLVNAASGVVLYEPSQPTDSKVIVAPNSVLVPRKGQHSIRHSTLERNLSENREGSRKALKKDFHNRCKEEAAFDDAISNSLEENARVKAEDKQLLEQAVNLSIAEKQKLAEEEKKLSAAIEISKRESIVNALDEDEQIRQTLALSKTEFDHQRDPDAYLQLVIELSRKERNGVHNEMLTTHEQCAFKHEENQDDEGLLKALELSVVDF